MDLLTAAFNVLMGMTPHKTDTESRDERAARMHIIDESIDDATKRAACIGQPEDCKPIFADRRLLFALLLGKGHFESDFAEFVHSGHCELGPKGACDAGQDGLVRAHSPWQIWKIATYPRTDWDLMQGATPEATHIAAWHAAKLLAGSSSRCKGDYGGDPIEGAIAGFAGNCDMMQPAKVVYQAATVRRILARLPPE